MAYYRPIAHDAIYCVLQACLVTKCIKAEATIKNSMHTVTAMDTSTLHVNLVVMQEAVLHT